MEKEVKKDLQYWKNNTEEDYIKTPISVLRYITELEKQVKNIAYEPVLSVVDCDHDWQSVFHFTKHVCDYCPDCDTIREL